MISCLSSKAKSNRLLQLSDLFEKTKTGAYGDCRNAYHALPRNVSRGTCGIDTEGQIVCS